MVREVGGASKQDAGRRGGGGRPPLPTAPGAPAGQASPASVHVKRREKHRQRLKPNAMQLSIPLPSCLLIARAMSHTDVYSLLLREHSPRIAREPFLFAAMALDTRDEPHFSWKHARKPGCSRASTQPRIRMPIGPSTAAPSLDPSLRPASWKNPSVFSTGLSVTLFPGSLNGLGQVPPSVQTCAVKGQRGKLSKRPFRPGPWGQGLLLLGPQTLLPSAHTPHAPVQPPHFLLRLEPFLTVWEGSEPTGQLNINAVIEESGYKLIRSTTYGAETFQCFFFLSVRKALVLRPGWTLEDVRTSCCLGSWSPPSWDGDRQCPSAQSPSSIQVFFRTSRRPRWAPIL